MKQLPMFYLEESDSYAADLADIKEWLSKINSSDIRLMAGEMTAQEMRTVLAVLAGLARML